MKFYGLAMAIATFALSQGLRATTLDEVGAKQSVGEATALTQTLVPLHGGEAGNGGNHNGDHGNNEGAGGGWQSGDGWAHGGGGDSGGGYSGGGWHNGGHHHQWPTPSNRITCYARDIRGVTFAARGSYFNSYGVQSRALNFCYSSSRRPRTCRSLGCF